MKSKPSAVALWLAFGVPILYGIESIFFYGRYLNAHLEFLRPKIPFAPEDVLGLGFWVTWALFAVAFVIASLVAFRLRRAPRGYLAWAFLVFVAVSVTDFALFEVLEKQVLKI